MQKLRSFSESSIASKLKYFEISGNENMLNQRDYDFPRMYFTVYEDMRE
jgi:hypothetical protein